MGYFYPLLAYGGLIGVLALLSIELLPRLHFLRRPVTAAWLTAMTLFWLAMPWQSQWPLSLWTPSTVLGGAILVDITPAVWILGLVVGMVLSGAAWGEAAEHRGSLSLVGVLALLSLIAVWLSLAGGSLLTVLAAWATFDLLWGIAGLMAGGDGERVTFGLMFHGIASLILWGAFLLLESSGQSVLWWLMTPSPAALTFLLAAAIIRMGLYPFHIVFPRRIGNMRLLGIIALMGPLLGLGLLYRILRLPGLDAAPEWLMIWGAISVLWGGISAWISKGGTAVLWGGYALLGAMVAGAAGGGDPELLLTAAGVWTAGGALVSLSRGHDEFSALWSWPAWVALLFFIGVPVSPLGRAVIMALDTLPFVWRPLVMVGWAGMMAAFISHLRRRSKGLVTPPEFWQQAGLLICMLLPLAGLMASALMGYGLSLGWGGLVLWGITVLLGAALSIFGQEMSREWLRKGQPVWEMFDLRWLFRALWRGAENLLSLVRASADVVEGNGALLWSLLVLLIVLLVVVNR